jgi:SOS-response transcriptional repressor LexA
MTSQAGEMVKIALKEKGMTQQELAAKIGRDQTLISRFISGVPIADDTARAMAEILDLDAEELLRLLQRDKYDRQMKKLKTHYRPVIGDSDKDVTVDVGHVGVVTETPQILLLLSYNQPIEKAEKYTVPTGVQLDFDKAFALKVSGKNLTDDKIEDGDIIIIDPSARRKDGDRILVTINNEPELRRFYRRGNTVVLQSHDNSQPPLIPLPQDDEIKMIGRVVFLHKIFR